METRRMEKIEWQNYFDFVSRDLPTMQVEIEVAGLEFGDQIQAEWTPLVGISYDPKDDVLFVHTAALDHAIHDPQDIVLEGDETEIRSITVRDAEGSTQTVRFKEALALPSARDVPSRKGA